MRVTNPRELFVHELADIYDGEQVILQVLPTLAQEAQDGQVRSLFQEHERETRQQVEHLDRCFQILGVQRPQVACHAIRGLQQEHESFLRDGPAAPMIQMFDLGAAAKTEHYEIASYRGLTEKATMLGQQECAQLLQENLRQEEQMARRVEQMSRQLGHQMVQQAGARI